MRPRMYVWAASLALALAAIPVAAIQHHPAIQHSGSRAAIQTTSFTGVLGQHIRSSPRDLLPTPPAVNLASLSIQPKTGVSGASASAKASRVSLYVKRSTPIHLSIPVIGVSAPLVALGLNANGSPQVPSSW